MKMRKQRERSLTSAFFMSAAVIYGVGILFFILLWFIPQSDVRYLALLMTYDSSPTLKGSELYMRFQNHIDLECAFIVDPIAMLIGGWTLARLAPSYASKARVLRTSAYLSIFSILLTLGFLWGLALLSAPKARPLMDQQLFITQLALAIGWTLVCVVGAWLGTYRRNKKTEPAPEPSASLAGRTD